MSYYNWKLTANQPYRSGIRGKLILIDSISGADSVTVQFERAGRELRAMPNRKVAFKMYEEYDNVIFTAAADCELAVFLGDTDVSLGFADGSLVNVLGSVSVENGVDAPVPVSLVDAVVNVTADNVGINNDSAHPVPVKVLNVPGDEVPASVNNSNANAIPIKNQALSTIVDPAPVTVGTSATPLIADSTLRILRIRNNHATAKVGIGASGITLAKAAVVLLPGDMWEEKDAAGAAWYAVSDTAATVVQLQTVK